MILARLTESRIVTSMDFRIALALLCLYACCLCIGIGFGGLFLLSRQSNALCSSLTCSPGSSFRGRLCPTGCMVSDV